MSDKPVNQFLDELLEEIKLAPKLYHQFEALLAENERQAKKLQIIQLEIDQILGTKTPTELRIEQALKGLDEQGS